MALRSQNSWTRRAIALAWITVGIVSTVIVYQSLAPKGAGANACNVTTPAQPVGAFIETFDGTPPSPLACLPAGWDAVATGFNSQEVGTAALSPGTVGAMAAHHGPACEPPGRPYTASNSHQLSGPQDAIFTCNGHLMTAPGLTGYGAVYLVPPAMLDFSQGPAVFSWDMSTLRTSSRDWVYITLAPFDGHNKFAYNNDQAKPPNNVKVQLAGSDVFIACQRSNGTGAAGNGCGEDSRISGNDYDTWDMVQSANGGLAQSASRRDSFRIELTNNHLRVCITGNNTGQVYTYRGASPYCMVDGGLTPLDPAIWHGHATVLITHVAYNPEKDCSTAEDLRNIVHNGVGDSTCPPNTWHWDNIAMSPTVPLAISNPVDRYASFNDPAGPNTVTFTGPVPANSYLSFLGAGCSAVSPTCASGMRVSFDGAPSIAAPLQPASTYHYDVGGEFWVPVPAGTTTVRFSGTAQYGVWAVQDANIWTAGAAAPPPTSSPPATSSPTPTPTPVPPTPSPSPTASPPTGPTTVTFNDLPNPDRALSGIYSGIDFGTGRWYLSAPWGKFTTNSISYPDPGPVSAAFAFTSPRTLTSVDAFNGGSGPSTVMLMCGSNPMVSQSVAANALVTITTNWTLPCSTVTVGSSNGWFTNFDTLVYR